AEAIRGGRAGGLVRFENIAHAAIADGVCVDLESGLSRALGDVGEMLFLAHQQAGVAGIVAVWREQRGAAAAQRAVGVALDRTNGQTIAVRDEWTAAKPRVEQRRI